MADRLSLPVDGMRVKGGSSALLNAVAIQCCRTFRLGQAPLAVLTSWSSVRWLPRFASLFCFIDACRRDV